MAILTAPALSVAAESADLPESAAVLPAARMVSQTAAEEDWRPAGTLGNKSTWYCDGGYAEPREFVQMSSVMDGQMTAYADDALLVNEHSASLDGRVEVSGDGHQIRASHVVIDHDTEIVVADGPVALRESGLFMKADRASGNLFSGTGVMDNASFLIHQTRMRGRAAKVEKTADETLIIENGSFTRCDPGNNLWRMRGDQIELFTGKGHGVARNVTIEVKDIPIAYLPYMRFPINDERYSGFLMPSAGHDDDNGTDIAIPYYFNIAPNLDATYTLRSLWKRGLSHDAEFRYMNAVSNNFINAAYLHGDDIYDSRDTFDLSTGGTLTEKQKEDRWLLYMNHAGHWGTRWRSQLSYGAVSDIDYLDDIGGDIDATTQEGFSNYQSLGTSIPALRRSAQLGYRGKGWSMTALARGYQSLEQNAAKQYSTLPRITAKTRHRLGFLQLQLLGQYARYDKDNDILTGPLATVGERIVLDASLNATWDNSWGYIKPTLGTIHRRYDLSDTPTGARSDPQITTPFLAIDTGMVFDRFFSLRDRDLLQTLEPRLYLLYMDEDDQADLPQFDAAASTPGYSKLFRRNRFSGYDRLGDARQASIGVSSAVSNADSGAEYFKASIGQVVYFKDREVIFRPGKADDPQAGSSALFTEARLRLPWGLSAYGVFEWEPREHRTNRSKLSLKYRGAGDRKIFNLSYSYTSPEVQQPRRFQNAEESDLSFIWPLRGKWSLIGRWNFGWDNNQTLESLFGLEYNDCCWKTRLAYRRYLEEPRNVTLVIDNPAAPGTTQTVNVLENRVDSGIYFEFQLKGLSSLGKRVDSLLEDSIPGYRRREDRISL
jgi:LPS-assembly protein